MLRTSHESQTLYERIADMIYIHETGVAFKKYKKTYHLFTDNFDDDFKELHDFAKKVGLQKKWFQNNKTLPHYDIFGSVFEKAKSNGGEMIKSNRFLVGIFQQYRAYKKSQSHRTTRLITSGSQATLRPSGKSAEPTI
jgi:hypothetical protein